MTSPRSGGLTTASGCIATVTCGAISSMRVPPINVRRVPWPMLCGIGGGGPLKIRLGGFGASNGACRHNITPARLCRSGRRHGRPYSGSKLRSRFSKSAINVLRFCVVSASLICCDSLRGLLLKVDSGFVAIAHYATPVFIRRWSGEFVEFFYTYFGGFRSPSSQPMASDFSGSALT